MWPDMRSALSKHKWANYSMFLRQDGLLVGYLESSNWEKSVAGMQDELTNFKWQEHIKPMF